MDLFLNAFKAVVEAADLGETVSEAVADGVVDSSEMHLILNDSLQATVAANKVYNAHEARKMGGANTSVNTTSSQNLLEKYDPMDRRDSLVYKAKLAEQDERFDEMWMDMKEVARQPQELTVEERNLLSAACKYVIGSRRASWRDCDLSSIEQKGDPDKMAIFEDSKANIENELVYICNDIIFIIEDSLIPNSTSEEAYVCYYKMKGDCHRYLTEFQTGDVRKDSACAALDAYQAASGIASSDLPPTHPIRLGLALNFSVFYYEILNSPDRACDIAKQAFDDAIVELDTLNEESYKDSMLIMQLLHDNLTLWTSDQGS